MKSLIILGVPRAGKSTLATNIAKKLSETGNALSLINADAIMGGLTAERGGYNLYKLLLRDPCVTFFQRCAPNQNGNYARILLILSADFWLKRPKLLLLFLKGRI